MRKKFIHFLWGLLFVTVLLTGLAFFAISEGWIGYVPELKQLDRPIDKFASQVLTSDGQSLGTYARSENRVFVSYDKISPYVTKALVATEDIRFYDHSGIDFRSLMRAVVKRGILGKESAGGTALFFHGKELHEAYDSKACGMGHSREIGTLLH